MLLPVSFSRAAVAFPHKRGEKIQTERTFIGLRSSRFGSSGVDVTSLRMIPLRVAHVMTHLWTPQPLS